MDFINKIEKTVSDFDAFILAGTGRPESLYIVLKLKRKKV
jgi:hypothetical protein